MTTNSRSQPVEKLSMPLQIACECGREVTAEFGQAGLAIPCVCGRTVQAPNWRRPQGDVTIQRTEIHRSRLTVLGWMFIVLALAAVLTASIAAATVPGATGPTRKFFGFFLVGGALLMVGATAALLRTMGIRFFKD